ncbi:hypothetical protein FO519_009688 [Halicephalobus sp. NKZ332]|nr:hypothetical protein FO519_009688 [Halicephalobus sp. NKZ332]
MSQEPKLVSDWMTYDKLLSQVEPGDLIEIQRLNFYFKIVCHWAVAVEREPKGYFVVNLTDDRIVHRDRLSQITFGKNCRINNSLDYWYPPLAVLAKVSDPTTSPGSLFLTADAFCNSNYNGHLISIPNAFVNTFIAQTIDLSNTNETFSRYWIGVNDIAGTGWTNIDDGSNITYFDWAPGEPSNLTGSNGCVSVDLKGLWHNDDCFTNYSFVCEVPELGATSTTPSTETTTKVGTTTSANDPLVPCWSYIPFAVDVSETLTLNQFSAMKNFMTTYFLKELFPIDLQLAGATSYSSNGGLLFGVQFNVSDMVTLMEDLSQLKNTASDLY